MEDRFRKTLDALSARDRLRRLVPAGGVDFCSNDYIALTRHDGIRRALIDALEGGIDLGAGGSRLLRGNHPAHEDLEAHAAHFFGTEAALFMATGYLANVALFTTLPGRGDVIVMDERIHASAKEGIHASAAKSAKFAHNDAGACENAILRLKSRHPGKAWIAVESVYSMDGDVAPLAELAEIAARHDAALIVDEAHATGALGPGGRGLAAALEGRADVVCLHTCGKALGQAGALVTGTRAMKDYLVNTARSFIYTTAPTPLAAIAVKHALLAVQNEPERRERLVTLTAQARVTLGAIRGQLPGETQILPFIVGEDGDAARLADRLRARGFDVRAIRTPTVAAGTARLRISITLNADEEDIAALAAALTEELQ
ncbi:MAG: 8-amino-7-oxononanoate synthase [Alphaproteobacteria bacterium]|nr:8-amino-7-oxononanoate synthase [Alphaproteobacteria bacterium]MBF0249735.1 8-amino-7-oxononanoate synthase [Alphaproteobacteria bacterium]